MGSWLLKTRRTATAVWQRFLRPWLRPVWSVFPLTKTGLTFVLLFGLAVWFQGVLHLDLVLLVTGLAGLLVITALLLCTLLGAALLARSSRRARTPGVLDLETGTPQLTGYSAQYPRWLPFTVTDWQWVDDGGGETAASINLRRERGMLVEMAAPARRCVVERVVRRFTVRDLFGLVEISWRVPEKVSLRVLPGRGMLTQMPPPTGLADGDDLADPYAEARGDRVEMRQYAPGDPLRMVLWKVYARTGKMMVRTSERSVAERHRGCAYLVTSPNDDATAAVARIAIERGLLGEDWCLAVEGINRHATESEEALEIIARSGETKSFDRDGALGSFLSRMAREGYQFCILFVPPDQGAWRYAAEQAAGGGFQRMQILVGVDRVRTDPTPPADLRRKVSSWFLKSGDNHEPTFEDLRQLASTTGSLMLSTGVAERQTGHLFHDILGDRN